MDKMRTILDRQLYAGRIYAKTHIFEERVKTAQKNIETMLGRTSKSYVALSWGKHSVTMARLVYSVDPSVLFVHWTGPDANYISNFDQTRDRFLSKWPTNYLELSEGPLGRLDLAIKEFVGTHDVDGVFVGLCAYESRGRRKTLQMSSGDNIFRYKSGLLRCCPIANWTQDDVAGYLAVHTLPLLNTYHRYGLEARTSVGCDPGSHAERGIDMVSRSNEEKIRARWREVEGWR